MVINMLKRDKALQIKQWDDEIRNYGGSESIWEYWITYGVPDHIEEWDVDDYASQFDYDDYLDFKRVYNACKKTMDREEDGEDIDDYEQYYLTIKDIDGDYTQYAYNLPVVKETSDFIYGQSMYGHLYKVNKNTNEVYIVTKHGSNTTTEKIGDTCRWYKQ